MDAYTASGWRPPTRPIASSILKTKKKQLKLAEPSQTAKSVTLQTISENHPLQTHTASINSKDSAQLRREISALQKQCATLESQRNEAFAELDKVLSAPQDQVNSYIAKIRELEAQRNELSQSAPREKADAYLARIKDLEAQRNDALEALDQVFSAPQPQATAYLAQISELKAQKRVLEERCKTFSAWAEQQRLECSKHAADSLQHKKTCEQLNEALSEFYAKHSALYAQHKDLEEKTEALKASMQLSPHAGAEQPMAAEAEIKAATERALEARNRAVAAEKTVQALLGVKSLIQSAPVGLELAAKTRSILKSAIDVLHLANQATVHESVQTCLTQVCSALANLGDEAAEHSVAANGWLAKRESVLRCSNFKAP
jgi:chromosome segregation ATPase